MLSNEIPASFAYWHTLDDTALYLLFVSVSKLLFVQSSPGVWITSPACHMSMGNQILVVVVQVALHVQAWGLTHDSAVPCSASIRIRAESIIRARACNQTAYRPLDPQVEQRRDACMRGGHTRKLTCWICKRSGNN